jgi:hypothetical protein
MKMQFELKECALPDECFQAKAWPGPGIYRVPTEPDRLYCVGSWSVDTIYDTTPFKPVEDTGEAVSESLLLKAIAAAAHAKVLS